MEKGKQTILQGALILTASTMVVKVIGALFKIPLANTGWRRNVLFCFRL